MPPVRQAMAEAATEAGITRYTGLLIEVVSPAA
jgi:hypothetical protein